jgi:hypothetical protein
VIALLATGVAAWLSQGTLAVTGIGDSRVALLPLSIGSASIVALSMAAVWLAWRLGASLAPLWLLALVALPWLPASLPAALQVWSGPLALMVWLGVGLSLACSSPVIVRVTRERFVDGALRDRPAVKAGALACAIYVIAAWQTSPAVPGGDEPHYLIITQSLLKDHDLRIENNHRNGDYRAYFAGELPKPDFRRRGRNGEIYSIHAPGLPAIVAPAFAIAGYHGVVIFLILLASAGSALAWRLAWIVTGRRDAAWFGWAVVTLSTTEIFHSFTVYPDGVGGVIVLTGVWGLLRSQQESETGAERVGPWWLHGAALAALPWIHTRFAVLAAGLGGLILMRLSTTKNPAAKAVAFLVIPAISALCWVGFFIAIYGTPDPSVPYANEVGAVSYIPGGLAGLFFDQRFGVLAYSPALICSLAGLVVMVRQRASRRLGLELLFVVVPYLLAVTHFAMWWGGASAPGRFFAPILPAMAIPGAVGWTAIRHRATRVTVLAALAYTAFMSSVLIFVDGGRLAYNVRQAYALSLEWLNGSIDLALGTPSWWQGQRITSLGLMRDTAIWLSVFGVAWMLLRVVESGRWLRSRGALCVASAGAYAVSAMLSLTIVWAFAGAQPVNSTPAQLEVLRRVSHESHLLALSLPGFRRVVVTAVPSMLRIQPRLSDAPGGAGPNDRPLYQIPLVPAGSYRVRPQLARLGVMMIGIGRDQFSLVRRELNEDPPVLNFPVDVRAIVIRGGESQPRAANQLNLWIEPLSIVPPSQRLTSDYAKHAVRYGTTNVYFLDERSFPEPEAFWVGGARTTTVALQPATDASSGVLLVRNAPVDNHVTFESTAWREEMTLGAGEERRVQVPIDPQRGAALLTITTSEGFRPSAVDPKSRDDRFLGVYVKVGEE